MSSCCVESFHNSNLWFGFPDIQVQRECAWAYKDYPIASRVVAIPVATVVGFIKPFFFPVVAAVGIVVLPVIAAIRHFRKGDASAWLGAWVFSILATGSCVAFMAISAFYLPLVASASIFMSALTISIFVHVYRACHTPQDK